MIRTCLAVFISAFLLCGCESDPDSESALTSANNGETITVNLGGAFLVILEGNPTTGFRWQAAEFNPDILGSDGEPEYKPQSDRIGGGGQFVFKFRARGEGTTALKLVYRRPFEEGVVPVESFEVTVVVK